MRPQELAMGIIGNHFDETAALTESVGFGAGLHGKRSDPHAVTGGTGLLLGISEAGNLWLTERHARHHSVGQRHRLHTRDHFGSYHALRRSHVGELNFGGDVTYRINMR